MRPFCLMVLMVALAGCAWHSEQPPVRNGVVDEQAALEIAREAVARNERWADEAQYDTPMRFADGSWTVVAWRIPKTSGGHRIISIDRTGAVTQYFRGR